MEKIKAQSFWLALNALLGAGPAFALPIQQYDLTFTVDHIAGDFTHLPSAFGDLSVGAALSMNLCWNPDAPPFAPGDPRFAAAVCGYSFGLGDYNVSTNLGSAFTRLGSGAFSFIDELPILTGPDENAWVLDEVQLTFLCPGYGSTLPSDLTVCGDGGPSGLLAVGPLTRPNGYCATHDCGPPTGGTAFTDLTSVKNVPEPGTFGLLCLGLATIGAVRMRRKLT